MRPTRSIPGRRGLLFLVALLGAATARAEEALQKAPAFDHEGVAATWVISLPPGYDAAKPWPLILDFHGAIQPSRQGAVVTKRALWARFVKRVPCIVVGLNGRTRAWGMIKGKTDDLAFARHVLSAVRKRFTIDPARIYLAGFSSGSDFLCASGIRKGKTFAASLVVCPGPPNVVGLRGGALLAAKDRPVLFATGEEDYVRKSGAWEAFVALDAIGAPAMYREVPGKAHEFFDLEEHARLFSDLEALAHADRRPEALAAARQAFRRDDLLLASSLLARLMSKDAGTLLASIEKRGAELVAAAKAVDVKKEPGRAYESWWRVMTQLHRFPKLAAEARSRMAALEKTMPRRDLYRARRDWFRRRAKRAPKARDTGRAVPPPGTEGLWRFDHYLTYDEMKTALADLAKRFPHRVKLLSMGMSIEGRDIPVVELTDRRAGDAGTKPAVYIQGGLHGNELSTCHVALYVAWQLAANPEKSRGTDRIMRDATVYVAPAVNPDAVHHYLAEAHSPWRPRFNYRPLDDDGDGRVDEDGTEDLDGDGEIGLMYVPDEKGPYVLADGKVRRGEGTPRYRLVGREGLDDDGDGKFSEDRPGGVDLNRNYPVGHRPGKSFGGGRGEPASEPETRAVIDFVRARPNVALFFDYHNNGDCLFFWVGPDDPGDLATYETIADRARSTLGYDPKPLRHPGAGLAIAWAYGARGITSFCVELESERGDREAYLRTAWKGQAFVPPRPFDHPTLGSILLGNDTRKIPRRNLHPDDLFWQIDRNWSWLKGEMERLPKLELRDPRISPVEEGFRVTGEIANVGELPTDTMMAVRNGTALPIRVIAEGAKIRGDVRLEGLAAGATRRFTVTLTEPADEVTVTVSHPRAGAVSTPVRRPRSPPRPIRKTYEILPGHLTPDLAPRAENAFYRKGRAEKERGPAFASRKGDGKLRVAVILGEWADHRHVIEATEFQKAFFSRSTHVGRSPTGQHVSGSVADFYAEMSYGRLEVVGRVFDWVELPGKHLEAVTASFGSRVLVRQMDAAVRAKHGSETLDDFDGYAYIWAGNSVRRTSMLWPMRLTFKDRPEVAAFKMSELFKGEMAPIGVACHELGHTFGVNDKYGLGANAQPVGPWCLMGKGTHGGPPSGRHRPFPMCAWCRGVIGWIEPVVVAPTEPVRLALRPVSFGPGEALRVLLRPDGSEYLLLTNRRREGFLSDLPSPGLVVLHVGPNDKPTAPQARVALVTAHGLPPIGRSDVAEPTRVAWPQDGKTDFEVGSVRVSEIRRIDDVVYFTVGPVTK